MKQGLGRKTNLFSAKVGAGFKLDLNHVAGDVLQSKLDEKNECQDWPAKLCTTHVQSPESTERTGFSHRVCISQIELNCPPSIPAFNL